MVRIDLQESRRRPFDAPPVSDHAVHTQTGQVSQRRSTWTRSRGVAGRDAGTGSGTAA